jgi:mRNA interferase MazF
MKRGDLITVSVQGDHGKPRPAVIVQSDKVTGVDTVLVAVLTSNREGLGAFRIEIPPSPANGLRLDSVVMLDKVTMVLRGKCGPVIGRLLPDEMNAVENGLMLIFGLVR